MSDAIICRNVGELVEALRKLPAAYEVHASEPPFNHVRVLAADGRVMVAPPAEEDRRQWLRSKRPAQPKP